MRRTHEQRFNFDTATAKTHLDGERKRRPLSVPLVRATNFQAASSRELGDAFRSRDEHVYPRFAGPNTSAAAAKLAYLEGAESALVFSSGMAAITTSLLTVLRPGDHVVAQRRVFAQTYTFLDQWARSYGVDTTFVETNLDAVTRAIRPETALIYIETPSNPTLEIVDIEAIAEIARSREARLFVDSTFAPPYLQRPLALGATLSLHSGSKYLSGHSDVLAGVVAGSQELIDRIRETQILLGGILDPQAAWLLLRGIKTLGLRVRKQCDNAHEIAQWLETQPQIEAVYYPWLESSPYRALADRQMRGGGGVVSFVIPGGLDGARAFVDALELIPIATSLGGVETVIEIPAELDFGPEELGRAGCAPNADPGLVRLAVGIEDPHDLLADLEQALERLGRRRRQAGIAGGGGGAVSKAMTAESSLGRFRQWLHSQSTGYLRDVPQLRFPLYPPPPC